MSRRHGYFLQCYSASFKTIHLLLLLLQSSNEPESLPIEEDLWRRTPYKSADNILDRKINFADSVLTKKFAETGVGVINLFVVVASSVSKSWIFDFKA